VRNNTAEALLEQQAGYSTDDVLVLYMDPGAVYHISVSLTNFFGEKTTSDTFR
jgi:hypothetical protein